MVESCYYVLKAWVRYYLIGLIFFYRLWEEAIHCCRINGTEKDTCEIAWAESLGISKCLEK